MNKKEPLFWRRVGIVLVLIGLVWLLYIGGRPVERGGATSDQVSVALATVRKGDILTFNDQRQCRVLEDRTPGNLMIWYACADEPQVVISTEIGPLAAQLRAVSPPVDEVSRIARLIVWDHASKDWQMPEPR